MTKLLKHSRFLATAAVSRLTRDHQVRLPDFLVCSESLLVSWSGGKTNSRRLQKHVVKPHQDTVTLHINIFVAITFVS